VDGLLDERRVRDVVGRLLDAGGRDGPAILSQFLRRLRLDRVRHTARVESAVPLPADVKAQIEADLSRGYGPGMDVSFAENPALIGGMRIRAGSDVYDGSVRAALDSLEKSL
jgi:F-type H+-transporting ATPase subunit delta